MSRTTHPKHHSAYVPAPNLFGDLKDIRILLDSIRTLKISQPIKKRMLVHALWEVAFATGNKQSSFFGRYRSEGVLRHMGLKVQRDHIFRKEMLTEQILSPSPDLDAIIARAECCLVTEDEHSRLGAVDKNVDGWERYRRAGITVYDMAIQPPQPVTEFPNA